MSGPGRGMGNGGGDLGSGRKHFSKEKEYRNKDEWRWKDKKDALEKVPVCHGCGVKGHKRPDCPERVASVRNPTHTKSKILYGTVGVNPCTLTLDSGADHTVVRSDLITESDYTGRSVRVGDYYGCWREVPCG